MKITREKFKELTGQFPEDMFGPDWEACMEEYIQDEGGNEHFHAGHLAGSCFECKMD